MLKHIQRFFFVTNGVGFKDERRKKDRKYSMQSLSGHCEDTTPLSVFGCHRRQIEIYLYVGEAAIVLDVKL